MKKYWLVVLLFISTHTEAQNWSTLNGGTSNFNYTIYADSVSDKLYVGGFFNYIGQGQYAKNVASWNGAWETLEGGVDNSVVTFCNYHDTLFVGGGFNKVNGIPSRGIAKWKDGHWIPMQVSNGSVQCLCVWNNELYVAGSFDTIAGFRANGLAKWNGTSWSTVGNLYSYYNHPYGNVVGKIVALDNKLYVRGDVTDSLGNVPDFLSWDGNSWKYYYGLFSGAFSGGYPRIEYKGQIYVIGLFIKAEGNVANCIATFDGTSLHDVGGGITGVLYPQIHDAFVYHDKLYVTGIFDSAGGLPASNIACWDGTKWCGLGSSIDDRILAITAYHDTLYIAGGFETIDDDTMNYIAKWLGGDYVDTCGMPVGIPKYPQANFSFSIAPNPTTDYLNIIYNSNEDALFELYNVFGQRVATMSLFHYFKNRLLDVSGFPTGSYFAVVKQDGIKVWSEEVIVAK